MRCEMTKAEFLEKLSKDILQLDNIIKEDTAFEEISEWDSLAQIATISFFDKELGISINFQEVQAAKSAQDLLKVFHNAE